MSLRLYYCYCCKGWESKRQWWIVHELSHDG